MFGLKVNINKYISAFTVAIGVVAVLGCSVEGRMKDRIESSADMKVNMEIQALIDSMSIEEKVGQMTQLDIRLVTRKNKDGSIEIDDKKLKKIIHTYKVGSILNAAGYPLTINQWHTIIGRIQEEALKAETPIPVIYGIDAIHGTTYTAGSTLFPHNIGVAASRNVEMAGTVASITASEVRASGIRWNFDPVLDIGREPLWSRFEETFGEDPYITKEMGVAMVKGYERDGLDKPTAVASTMKHFVGYSAPDNGKDRTPAYIPDKILWEYYLPQFKAAVEAGASTIMINSGSVNGIPLHADKYLLEDVLRKQFGFKGLIVTDWEDIIRLHTRHKVAETPRDAVKLAIESGIDMSMVPSNLSFFEHLTDLVKAGEISEQRLDQSVRIILKLKYRLGLFDNAFPESAAVANFAKPSYQKTALEAALESITLLKNDDQVLPLPKTAKVLIAGPAANNLAPLHGSWSYSWQGDQEERYPETTQTVLEALQDKITKSSVRSLAFEGFDNPKNYDAKGLKKATKNVDYIVLVLGENAYAESPGGIDDLTLAQNQIDLAKAAIATKTPVIMVLAEGRPRIVREIEPGIKAIVQAYRPGSQGAKAIVDVLFGDYNPSGVLPFSYPQFTGDIMPYDHEFLAEVQEIGVGNGNVGVGGSGGYKPQWSFGHGLSYTTFEVSNLKVNKKAYTTTDTIDVSVTVANTGKREGGYAVDLYVSDLYASESPAVKRLKRFKKVFLDAGQQTTIEFSLTQDDLAFVNRQLDRVVEPGEFRILVGNQSVDFVIE